jgi:signal transduction histidine kinase
MRELVASFGAETGTAASFHQRGTPVTLPGRVAAGLYSLVFDVLTTVQRGSRASALVVTLSEDKDSITLSIRDDGTDLSQRNDGGPWPGVHHGMRVVRDRAAALGATVRFEAAKPRGVEVLVRLPVGGLGFRGALAAQPQAARRRPARPTGATISRIG